MKKTSKYVSRKTDAHNYVDYPEDENLIWKRLSEQQLKILPGRACQEYLDGMNYLQLPHDKVPQIPDINAKLNTATGWSVEPVAALIGFNKFFNLLANRKFPCATFIRTAEDFSYIQEPDIFHEIFGHTPMLAHPVYADFMQKYGELGVDQPPYIQKMLARFYWFTVEFGLLKSSEGLRAYGGGILSSPGETIYALDDESVIREPFNVLNILRTPYRINIFQPVYYYIDSYQQIYDVLNQNFIDTIKEAQSLGEFTPLYEPELI